ncbi:MAG: hypothetical protein Q8N57_01075 [bacterium]|nr:hypothetical protein [bacterium]
MSKILKNEEEFVVFKKDDEVAVILNIKLKNDQNIIHGKIYWNNKESKELDINTGSEDVFIKYSQIDSVELFD